MADMIHAVYLNLRNNDDLREAYSKRKLRTMAQRYVSTGDYYAKDQQIAECNHEESSGTDRGPEGR